MTGIERRDVDALVLWFVVVCGGDVDDADGRVAGAAGVGGLCRICCCRGCRN